MTRVAEFFFRDNEKLVMIKAVASKFLFIFFHTPSTIHIFSFLQLLVYLLLLRFFFHPLNGENKNRMKISCLLTQAAAGKKKMFSFFNSVTN